MSMTDEVMVREANRITFNSKADWWNVLTDHQRRRYLREPSTAMDEAFKAGVLAALAARPSQPDAEGEAPADAQRHFNRSLRAQQVAETRLRIVERVNLFLSHDLPRKLALLQEVDQLPMLYRLEEALKAVLR
jgi:hypothetical protein